MGTVGVREDILEVDFGKAYFTLWNWAVPEELIGS